ncbi:MAG TPA: hypothetical protein VM925_14735 [Labilithrix sp.]|nr:hypothetical protein [Labilithrix sp.]
MKNSRGGRTAAIGGAARAGPRSLAPSITDCLWPQRSAQAALGDQGPRATKSSVTISEITKAHVAGYLDLEFADGSKVAGAFDVPTCNQTTPDSATCL